MKDLTLIIVGNRSDIKEDENVEFLYTNKDNIKSLVNIASGKYIAFIREEDKIAKDYLKVLLSKVKSDFDCCFINYIVEYDYLKNINICINEGELAKNKPYFKDYFWAYIFDKKKLQQIIDINDQEEFDKKVNELFVKTTSIGQAIYFHNPKGKKLIKDFVYSDIKSTNYSKNLIYVGDGCSGTFNGYVSWVKNIGRCFGDDYEITILYEHMEKSVYEYLSKYFRCLKRKNDTNYCCHRLLVTYGTYYYPKNVVTLEDNYMFIHGNMSDYKNTRVFYDDIYTHYVAVSKIAAKKAEGYFPTKNIEYIINPFKLEEDLLKPHLTLTSAFKYSDVKKPERVEKIASILDELDIPYTWNVFTDKKENTNINGLIFRKRTANPIPYIKDSDYFVLLSDSEAMPYCIMEALSVNTKVIVTPLEAYDELGIVDGDNGFIIPFDYFEESNKTKLVSLIKKIYKEKEKEMKYKLKESLWKDYNKIFLK